jgi:hypothetical protein
VTKRDNSARRLLRLKPAIEYLSVSPGTLRALCQRGEIPVIRLTENGHAPWLIDPRGLSTAGLKKARFGWKGRVKVIRCPRAPRYPVPDVPAGILGRIGRAEDCLSRAP